MIEEVIFKDIVQAIIIRASYSASFGTKFLTPNHFSQQMAYIHRPKNFKIEPHRHLSKKAENELTHQEVLFVKSGLVRVDFYSEDEVYIESRELKSGDVILLAKGGHGFEMIEDSEIIEVKTGPYLDDSNRIRFGAVSPTNAVIKN